MDRSDITQRVVEKLFDPSRRAQARTVIHYMAALRQAETAKSLDDLSEYYDPFNPDDETINTYVLSPADRRMKLDALKAKIIDLAESANYIRISDDELKTYLASELGGGFAAEVDLSEYDFHLLFYRGEIKDHIYVRTWKRLWLKNSKEEFDAYRRLFLALKLKPFEVRAKEIANAENISKGKAERKVRKIRNQQMLEGVSTETLHLKVFRRIAKRELRILFPNAKIKFTPFDRLWLWIGSGGSTVFAIGVAVLKFLAAVAISLAFVVITLAGAVGAIFRAFMNFFNTRTRYMAKLAKSLYFHTLANNQSVLTHLSDDAEEEDIKEGVLTYAGLLKFGHLGQVGVKDEIEKFLKDEFGTSVDFDIEDGFVHLRKLGLLVDDEHGSPRILDLDDAYQHLVKAWEKVPVEA